MFDTTNIVFEVLQLNNEKVISKNGRYDVT